VRAFVRQRFGLRGTLRLHRAAVGADLLRAPVNVVLAPVFLLVKILARVARLVRMPRVAGWLARREVFLTTAVSRAVREQVTAFVASVTDAPRDRVARAVADYAATRNAVAEIVTTLVVLLAGVVLFHAVTPGVISLAGPLAEAQAARRAAEGFWLGQGAGRLYYGVFPVHLPVWQVVLTGAGLAMAGSVVTTFAGVIADPVQVATGVHRRRLMRLIARVQAGAGEGLAREHVIARTGDLSDMALSLWRMLRG
jgi:hypothetical protein